jgi:hypothetical protein
MQRIGKETFAGTRGNDKVAPKRSSAEADHTLLQGSAAGFSRVLPGPTYSAARRKNRNDSGKCDSGIRVASRPFRQNADADYCQWIAKIRPYWVSD